MTRKIWNFQLENGPHTVTLEHGYFSGKKAITIDGWPLQLPRSGRTSFGMGGDYPFQMGPHWCAVHVRTNGFTYSYDFSIDGRSIQSGQPVAPNLPMPWWAWLFVAVCAFIPILSLGGAIPAAIGAGGALGCALIAKDGSKPTQTRVVLCITLTAVCWGLFFALIAATVGFFRRLVLRLALFRFSRT